MATEFDAYYTWLGIPPEEQPPNHYRLLGIRLLETNRDVIQHAADRQMAHLKSFNTSQHAAYAQKLLNELAGATNTLLTAAKKQAYDQELKSRVEQQPKAGHRPPPFSHRDALPVPIELPKLNTIDPLTAPLSAVVTDNLPGAWRRQRRSGGGGTPPWVGLGVLAVVVLAALIAGIVLLSGGEGESDAGATAPAAIERS